MSDSENGTGDTPITVRAKIPGTEIYIIDGWLRLVAQTVDLFEGALGPGIYRIKFRLGGRSKQRTIRIAAGSEAITIEGGELAYQSAAPFVNTLAERRESQSHWRVAQRFSTTAMPKSFGEGARLFIFVRSLDIANRSNPARSVTLHSLDGAPIVDTADFSQAAGDTSWAALRADMSPGLYRLRSNDGVRDVEQTLLVCQHRETQVFLHYGRGPREKRFGIVPASTVVLSTETGTDGFNPDSPYARLTDLVIKSLSQGGRVLSSETVEAITDETLENPLLGLAGAYYLTRRMEETGRDYLDMIAAIARNLRRLMPPNPDLTVILLWLAEHGDASASETDDLRLDAPPMLAYGWSLAVRASVVRSDVMPVGSFASAIAERVLPAGSWLVWRALAASTRDEVAASPPAATDDEGFMSDFGAVQSFVEAVAGKKTAKTGRHQPLRELGLTRAEESIVNSVSRLMVQESLPDTPRQEARKRHDPGVRRALDMAAELSLPRSVFTENLRSVASKLSRLPSFKA